MIIKFTDLHQIKLIRSGPCRERAERPIFLILPRGCFKCFEHGTFFSFSVDNERKVYFSANEHRFTNAKILLLTGT